jgi:hypothetical protein
MQEVKPRSIHIHQRSVDIVAIIIIIVVVVVVGGVGTLFARCGCSSCPCSSCRLGCVVAVVV